MTPVPLLVIGDDPLARGSLFDQLRRESSLQLVGQSEPQHAPAAVRAQRPAALVWDLGERPREALGLIPSVVQSGAPCAVLLDDDGLAQGVVSAGIAGVVRRDSPPGQVAAAAIAVAHGLVAYSAELAPHALRTGIPLGAQTLTPRETEVLALLTEGLSNKQIAARLDMSEHTAKFHVTAIITKLGAQSRTEAVVRGARLGLVML